MYKPTLVITDELREKWLSLAKDSIVEIYGENFLTTEEFASTVTGYVLALEHTYVKNNGVPPIPFPISLSTVDMICYINTPEGIKILMGRKPNQPKWQFPGGFRDPRETSREAAARELSEEACLFNIDPSLHVMRISAGIQEAYSRLESIGELFIDDIRYRETPHKITTHIFMIEVTEEESEIVKAGDDLGEVRWSLLQELYQDNSDIRDIHLQIFERVAKYLTSVKETQTA